MPLLVLYCCDVLESKDVSAVRQGFAVKIPSLECTVTGNDIISSEMNYERFASKTKMTRSHFLKIQRNNTRIVAYRTELVQNEGADCNEELLRKSCYQFGHLFLKRL